MSCPTSKERPSARPAWRAAEAIQELMEAYDVRRKAWMAAKGTSTGFDEWFTGMVPGLSISEVDGPDLRTYSNEALLAAVARHAKDRGLTMDLAYRTKCNAPAELLVGEAQFKVLLTELKRRDVGGASDLFRDRCPGCGYPHEGIEGTALRGDA